MAPPPGIGGKPNTKTSKIQNRIRAQFGQVQRCGGECFQHNVAHQFDGKLFAFKMPHIGNDQAAFGIKKLVVLEISGHKCIGFGAQGFGEEKAASPPTNGYFAHGFVAQGGMADAGGLQGIFEVLQKLGFLHGLG